MSITISSSSRPIRIMRETLDQVKLVEQQYKDRDFQYIGQVKDNLWLDGEKKGS